MKKKSPPLAITPGSLLKKPAILKRYPIGRRTLERWMANGTVPYLKLGSSPQSPVFFDPAAVEAALMRFNRGAA